MEEKKEIKIKLGTFIMLIILVVALAIIGGLCWYIYVSKNSNNNISISQSQNVSNSNRANTIDPYANYKNIQWTRTTKVDYPSIAPESYGHSMWIDDSGIMHMSDTYKNNPAEETTINLLPEKAKYFTDKLPAQTWGATQLLILTEEGNLYVISDLYESPTIDASYDPETVAPYIFTNNPDIQKIASNILEIYQDEEVWERQSNTPDALSDAGRRYIRRKLCFNVRWKIT